MYSSWLAETINAQNRLYVYVYGWSKHAQFEYALERLQVRDEKRVGQVRWGGGGGEGAGAGSRRRSVIPVMYIGY